jgi:glycosyltransferase involved in cell wall biosynthesis
VQASVIVPTYNRCDLLRRTLETLARQRCARDEFEVIVADDGSTDGTADVVAAFGGRLQIRHHFQADRGYRLAAVRNAGARLAGTAVLIFLDSGTLAGPDFVPAHLRAHAAGGRRAAVVGYTYGYQPWRPVPGPDQPLEDLAPELVVDRLRDDPRSRDWRHGEFSAVDFDINRRATPWLLFMGMNCSIRSEEYWAAGGFDEDFQSWGVEDLELGYRLFKRGVPFLVSRDAWALEMPHRRDVAANLVSAQGNAATFLRKHPEPVIEITWKIFLDGGLWSIEPEYRALLSWIEEARDLHVGAELEQAREALGAGRSFAVFGCGSEIPAGMTGGILLDFDRDALDRAVRCRPHGSCHALGIRTPLPDGAVDVAVVTSRLRGLWTRWGRDVLTEARRVGRSVLATRPDRRAGPT